MDTAETNPFIKSFKPGDRIIFKSPDGKVVKSGKVVRPSCYACWVRFDGMADVSLAMNDCLNPEPQGETMTQTATPATTEPSIADIDARNLAAVRALIKVAGSQKTLTADDVLKVLQPSTGTSTRFMSSIMAQGAKSGLIRRTKDFVRSERTSGPLAVWESTYYGR